MKQSHRFQVLKYITNEFPTNGEFLPYLNERDGIGHLILKKNKIQLVKKQQKKYCLSPLPISLFYDEKLQSQKTRKLNQQINSNSLTEKVDPSTRVQLLTYLLSKNQNELTEQQAIQIQNLLTQMDDEAFQETNNAELSAFLDDKDLIISNEDIKGLRKKPSSNSPKLKLLKRPQFDSKTLDFLNYSIDCIKPKKVTNVIISQTSSQQKQKKNRQNQFYSRQSSPISRQKIIIQTKENEKMYQNLLLDVNKLVRKEQMHNQENLLYPNKHLSLSPIDGSFALKNQEKLIDHFELFKQRRKKLFELQKKMENIITYRRYGERNLEDDKWYLQ